VQTVIWGKPIAWAKYKPPGHALGIEVKKVVEKFKKTYGKQPDIIFLKNHGLICSAKNGAAAVRIIKKLLKITKKHFGNLPSSPERPRNSPKELVVWFNALKAGLHNRFGSLVIRPARMSCLVGFPQRSKLESNPGPLIPDDIIYLGSQIFTASRFQSPARFVENLPDRLPPSMVVAVMDLGYILCGSSENILDMAEENLLAHHLTRTLISRRGKPRTLPKKEIDYLSSMESEKYRQALASQIH